MNNAPTYALYGEFLETVSQDVVHCETIRERSARHNWLIKPHQHRQYAQIFLFRSSGVDVRLGGDVHRNEGPLILFVPPFLVHGFHFPETISGLVVTLEMGFVTRSIGQFGVREDLFEGAVLVTPDDPRFATLQMTLENIEKQGHAVSGLRSARLRLLAEQMLLDLAEYALDRQRCAEKPFGEPSHERMQAFFVLLEEHFATGEPIDFYARHLAISSVQLTRICRKVTGSSPHELLTARRILEAKRLLRFTSQGVGEIADQLCFANIAYFSHFFKKHTGLCPGAYRQEGDGRGGLA